MSTSTFADADDSQGVVNAIAMSHGRGPAAASVYAGSVTVPWNTVVGADVTFAANDELMLPSVAVVLDTVTVTFGTEPPVAGSDGRSARKRMPVSSAPFG